MKLDAAEFYKGNQSLQARKLSVSMLCEWFRIVQQRKNGCARMMRGLKAKLEELEQEKEEYKREIESTQGNFENSVQVGEVTSPSLCLCT